MNSTLAAASYQASLAQASSTVFSAVAVNNSLAGMSVQKNDGSRKHIPTQIENIGANVLRPVVDSLSYWAGRSVEMWQNFLSFPGASAAQVGHNQSATNQTQKGSESPIVSRISVLREQFKGDNTTPAGREAKSRLVPEAEFLLNLAEREKIVDTEVGFLANELGGFFRITGNLDKAKTYSEQGLNAYIAAHGTEDHLTVAVSYNNLGNVLETQGDFAGAKQYYERALSILLTKHQTENHPDVAVSYNNLSVLFLTRGDAATAKRYAEKAVNIYLKIYETEGHVNLAMSYNTLGNVQRVQSDFAGAEVSYRESLRILHDLYGAESRADTGTAYNNLGIVLQARGDLKEARKCFEDALKMKIESYGKKEHTEVAVSYNSLGSVLEAQGDLDGAEDAYREGYRIFTACYGTENHFNIVAILNHLGLVLEKKNHLAGARECFETALAMQVKLPGNPLNLAGGYRNLAILLEEQGDLVKAKEYFKKTIDFYIAGYKTEKHKDVVSGYTDLGDLCFSLRQFEEAKLAYKKARDIAEQLFGNEYNAFFDAKIRKCKGSQ